MALKLADGWYCIGWDDLATGEIRWEEIVQIESGAMFTEDGDEVDRLYCPTLWHYVATDAADHYAFQNPLRNRAVRA